MLHASPLFIGQARRYYATGCTGEVFIRRASSVQQDNAVSLTSSNHVGRPNAAVVVQLNNVRRLKSQWSDNTTAGEVGLLSVHVLRGESETFHCVYSSILPQQALTMRTVRPVEVAAPDRVV